MPVNSSTTNGHGPYGLPQPGPPPAHAARDRPAGLTRTLLWVAGTDPGKVETRTERYRAAGTGMFVVLIALVAAGSLILYLQTVIGALHTWFIVPALIWGVIVFQVDRMILIEPNYGRLDRAESLADQNIVNRRVIVTRSGPPVNGSEKGHEDGWLAVPPPSADRGSGVSRVGVYVLRFAMALAIAYLVSEALVLMIFRPEVDQELTRNGDVAFERDIAALAATEADALLPRIQTLRTEIADLDADLAQKKRVVDEARANYNGEADGTSGTGVRGSGPQTRAEWENLTRAQRIHDTALADRDNRARLNSTEIQNLTVLWAELRTPTSGAVNELRESPRGKALYAQTHGQAGWLAREQAFADFQQRTSNATVHSVPWVIRALFVLVDLLPLTMKLLNIRTLYGRRVRDEAQLLRYEDRLRHVSAMRRAGEKAALADHAMNVAARLDYDSRETYYRTRADHLGRQP
ncbi:uncharacterized small protein (DUF1192 family) [Kibdelosporangium banguiense]|uniref:Uncharacterized small protein (DUF1192 family) n=1 Tax=Kibdelosporangium banguiense TaxID=1365924 RepID=A0ABS4TLB2_9PSEU|nr:DUF4407 domain-containing protein [Kibdelosporangium banguiense]MBP2324789.1 uncharacterized small protein (DUF1192 family) [Kibdelosporangium banguiense]